MNQSASIIDRQLAGIYSFQIMLEGPPESLRTPDSLARMDRLQAELRRGPHVRKVTSLADYVKRIHRELNDGRADANVIPSDSDTIAQELFVFALGGEGRHELERIVASDYSRAQIFVKLQSMSSDLLLEQVEGADRMAKEAFAGTGISVLTTGSGRLFSTLDHYLVASQVTSFGTAFVTVFAVIFLVFRSARFGLLTIVPNLLPVVAVLGVMGYLDISLNIATVMVASVALGVVDDDTIHFINRYRREVAAGASTDQAIGLATAHEGRASLTTAIINCCGFGVLLMSEYKPTAWFGGLLALTMIVAFLAEVLILPATIKLLPGVFGATALRRGRTGVVAALLVTFVAGGEPASAQTVQSPSGHVSLFADYVPNRGDTVELRGRVFAEEKINLSPRLHITASGFVEGLLARRPVTGDSRLPTKRRVEDAVVRVQDAHVDFAAGRVNLLAGFARVAWGRLDEIQPTDVVNPLDVSRFLFEGRSEARLPVALLRARVFVSEAASIEGVYVPFFRRGRFDLLDEPSSPFVPDTRPGSDLVVCLALGCPTPPLVFVQEPGRSAGNGQGGVRFSSTSGRVDWSLSAYRGFETFALYEFLPPAGNGPALVAGRHPRFTMVGGDFETVRGAWGIRGEVAAFLTDNFQAERIAVVDGSSIDAGVGIDRKAGFYRVSGTVLLHRETYDEPLTPGAARDRTDLSLVVSADRSFARERYKVRAFGVANASQQSGFARVIASAELRDDLLLEGSAAWLLGDSDDVFGRLSDSDFACLRLKYHF